jgi:hypothetical protein
VSKAPQGAFYIEGTDGRGGLAPVFTVRPGSPLGRADLFNTDRLGAGEFSLRQRRPRSPISVACVLRPFRTAAIGDRRRALPSSPTARSGPMIGAVPIAAPAPRWTPPSPFLPDGKVQSRLRKRHPLRQAIRRRGVGADPGSTADVGVEHRRGCRRRPGQQCVRRRGRPEGPEELSQEVAALA